jgi:hypothetical protein
MKNRKKKSRDIVPLFFHPICVFILRNKNVLSDIYYLNGDPVCIAHLTCIVDPGVIGNVKKRYVLQNGTCYKTIHVTKWYMLQNGYVTKRYVLQNGTIHFLYCTMNAPIHGLVGHLS